MTSQPAAAAADIVLLLEGSYPFISGGVSGWVHQIIQGLPEFKFACLFVGSRPEDYGEPRYRLPGNVVHLETHYLYTSGPHAEPRPQRGNPQVMAQVVALHEALRDAHESGRAEGLSRHLASLVGPQGVEAEMFLRSRLAWDFLCARYRAHCTEPSFVDFFWTLRGMHGPIWKLQQIVSQFSLPAGLFHTISTGYAGLLGAMFKVKTGRPLLVTEHGIYTKERQIDLLLSSDWPPDHRDEYQYEPTEIGYLRALWMRFFASLGRLCYDAADQIITLFEANRRRQIEDGAPAEKTRVISNGVNLQRFCPRPADAPIPPVLCLIGRVVPIKDVHTYIRAVRIVINRLPHTEAWIAGPENEDPAYAAECRDLAKSLGLEDKVRFLGMQKVNELLPRVGLTVLSSISEGLPLVVLESMASGIPLVTTDVGSCRELLEGREDEDRALGPSGSVVPIANPAALAEACIGLLTQPERWRAASRAGRQRVERFYREDQLFDTYRSLYRTWLAAPTQKPTQG